MALKIKRISDIKIEVKEEQENKKKSKKNMLQYY